MNAKDALQTLDHQQLAPVQSEAGSLLSLVEMAVTQKASPETLERLLNIKQRYEADQARAAFNAALAGFQGDCPVIKKSKVVLNKGGTGVRYRYAPLDQIIIQVQPILLKWGFNYQMDSKQEGKLIAAICTITHTLGHHQTSTFQVPIDPEAYMNEAQKFASALTFARRYAFCNAFGIVTGEQDDDSRATAPNEGPAVLLALKKELWELLKPVRGDLQKWEQAEQWLIDECCMQPEDTIKEMDAARMRDVIVKAKFKIPLA